MADVRSAMLFGGGDNFSAVLFLCYAIPDALVKSVPGNPMTPELRAESWCERNYPPARVVTVRSNRIVSVNSPGKVTIRASYAG